MCCQNAMQGATELAYIFTSDGVDDIVRRRPQQLGDNRELVDVVLAREEGLSVEHLGKDAPGAPDVHLHVVLLPREHDLRCPIVPRRDVSRHLGILQAGEPEVADLEVAILVDEDVARLEIAVDDAGRVDVFQATLLRIVSVAAGGCQLGSRGYEPLSGTGSTE
jgi:hypothetical protein